MILIYSTSITPRLQYTIEVLFKQIAAVKVELTSDKLFYKNSSFVKINYSTQRISEQEVFIPISSNILFEQYIKSQPIHIKWESNLPYFFNNDEIAADFVFDFFAMSFYLLSRYEEYLPFSADQHQRFPASQSLAYQNHFLQSPIIEIWLEKLKEKISLFYPRYKFPKTSFNFHPTYDIDHAWAYLYKNIFRTLGASLLDLLKGRYQLFNERWNVLFKQLPDPYALSFKELDKIHQAKNLSPIYFILLGDYGKYDKNTKFSVKPFQYLLSQLHKQYQIGIHPSYQSNSNFKQLVLEIKRLEHIINTSVTHSRQHFLKLSIPHTYHQLIEVGILHDYSLGYADAIGFRASTSYPYQWYDLVNEKTTSLTIHPFCVMDVTLKQYLKIPPNEVVTFLTPMIQQLKSVGGNFSTIWHNSSFSSTHGWAKWETSYKNLIDFVLKE